jgi:hypothetical protein
MTTIQEIRYRKEKEIGTKEREKKNTGQSFD